MSIMADCNWNTTRINRILRPLHSTTNSLSSICSQSSPDRTRRTRGAVARTYSKRARADNSQQPPLENLAPPLAMLPHPDNMLHHCFKNVISAALRDQTPSLRHDLPGLGSLCAILVGEHINVYLDSEDEADEDELSRMLENMYEAIPMHFRWRVLISHALDVILRATPHHPTLLMLLLEVCIENSLVLESRKILEAILVVAASPISEAASTPRICHVAHGDFLVDLLLLWGRDPYHSPMSFVETLVRSISSSCFADVWTSRAVSRLMVVLRDAPMGLEMSALMARGLASCLQSSQESRSRKSRGSDTLLGEGPGLCHLFSRWLNFLLSRSIEHPDYDCSAVSDILAWLGPLRICSKFRSSTDLSNSITSLTVHCLAMHTSTLPAQRSAIIHFLHAAEPTSSTFDPLIESIATYSSMSSSNFPRGGCALVRKYTASLRSAKLFHLEASLWAAALSFVDGALSCPRGTLDSDMSEFIACQKELIEAVEEAEFLCFSGPGESLHEGSVVSTPSQSSGCTSVEGDDNWRWEDSMGCWVRRDDPTLVRPPKRLKCEAPRKAAAICLPPERPVSLATSFADSKPLTRSKRSRQSFTFPSLLRDAYLDRVVLHEKENRSDITDSSRLLSGSECTSEDENVHSSSRTPLAARNRLDLPPEDSLMISSPPLPTFHLPSDDALDLFTYH
ncbi:hypothetical protein HGRIS_002275 [Hohenbuehelia grisea]|uniref:Uncharacterized protein n=1 Tax=Hohenbuehelia grisea TaxID=104357 RepID=A0ABR3JKQ6_9AGAR